MGAQGEINWLRWRWRKVLQIRWFFCFFLMKSTLQGTRKHIPPNEKRKIIGSKVPLGGDMLVPRRVHVFMTSVVENEWFVMMMLAVGIPQEATVHSVIQVCWFTKVAAADVLFTFWRCHCCDLLKTKEHDQVKLNIHWMAELSNTQKTWEHMKHVLQSKEDRL